MYKKLVFESLNEIISFERRGDPLSALGVGKKTLIINWLEKYKIKNYTIDKDFTINVDNYVDLEDKNINEIPKYIKFNKIDGWFNCDSNNLTTLKPWCPEETGSFYCAGNQLTSLKGCPNFVDGDFYCDNNKTKFTKQNVLNLCIVTGDIEI